MIRMRICNGCTPYCHESLKVWIRYGRGLKNMSRRLDCLLYPKAYVDALLDVHHKNSETVTRSFRGEAGFVASLDKACREFINRNAATGTSTTKSPELLAKHADMLLRKNNKMAEEGDLEGALNRVVGFDSIRFVPDYA
jgi:hypothetical protein